MKQVSIEPKKGPKFWQPKPGEEIFFSFPKGGAIFRHYQPSDVDSSHCAFPCLSNGTFETAHQCLPCKVLTGVFVAALLTYLFVGPEAAKAYYQGK